MSLSAFAGQVYGARPRRGATDTALHPIPHIRRFLIRGMHLGRRRAVTFAVLAAALTPAGPAHGRMAIEPSEAPAPPAEGAADRGELVGYAKRFIGTPYVWGGSSPAGFDCSGFTSYVYARFGVQMAHYTGAQYAAYRKVARGALQPGDLVFFAGLGHEGIYIGGGRFIHSPSSGGSVRIDRLADGWYRDTYVGAVRPPFPRSGSMTVGPATAKSSGSRSASSAGSRA